MTNVLSPTGETLSYTYDGLDNVASIRFGDGNSLTNFYNAENRLSGVRLPSGVTLTNFYDFAGRLTNRNSSIGETAGFEYNGNDAVTKMTDNTGATTNLFDAAGRLWGIDYPSGASVRYQLDVLDRIIGITNKATALGTTYVTRYQYDPVGNVTNVIDPFNGNTGFEFDRVGRKTKRTLPNGIVTTWDYNWRDQVTNIVHKTSGGTTLASVLYERLAGGEPSKITREDGTYVELKYDTALRLTNEIYYASGGAAQTTNSYAYDSAGSRIKLVKGGLAWTNVVSSGYRITEVRTNGVVAESYSYDNGGRVTTITQDGITKNLGYNSADQVRAVTNGAAWVTYTHDASGRRTFATNSASVVRKFLVAFTPGTDLESPQLIANASGSVQQGYVYLGDDPILRYSTGGTAAYYLEDGMGSVIGIAPASSPSTANTTRLFYDGFGNSRGTNGPAPTIPTGTGGDFRFHGQWLEADSGLYNMRAREYDARMGRFTSRDPVGGDITFTEVYHPYVFALNNPIIYSDPSGQFNLLELSITETIQAGLQAFRAAAVNYAREWAREKIGGFIVDQLLNLLGAYFPAFSENANIKDMLGGKAFEKLLRETFCKLPGSDYFYFEAGVWDNNNPAKYGDPENNGLNCETRRDTALIGPKHLRRPDVIVGRYPPVGVNGQANKTWLVGEFKIRTTTFLQYKRKKDEGQLLATVMYASKHTETRTALFLSFTRGKSAKGAAEARTLIKGKAAAAGANAFVVSLDPRDWRRPKLRK